MDFGASQVVDQGVPILVKAFQRVAVFVQRGAVELGQTVGIGGEMRRHPIENHADVGLVTGIDERREIVRRAETRRRGKL